MAAQLAVSTSHKASNLFFVIPSPSWSPAIVQPIKLQTLIQNVGIWMVIDETGLDDGSSVELVPQVICITLAATAEPPTDVGGVVPLLGV